MALSGNLEDMSIIELIQFPFTGRKTGELIVAGPEAVARLFYRDGAVIHAEMGELPSFEVLVHLLDWESGEFEFRPGDPVKVRRSLTRDLHQLLMEALKTRDERRAGAAAVSNAAGQETHEGGPQPDRWEAPRERRQGGNDRRRAWRGEPPASAVRPASHDATRAASHDATRQGPQPPAADGAAQRSVSGRRDPQAAERGARSLGHRLEEFLRNTSFVLHCSVLSSTGAVRGEVDREGQRPELMDETVSALHDMVMGYPREGLERMVFSDETASVVMECTPDSGIVIVAASREAQLGAVLLQVGRLSTELRHG